MRLAKPSNGHIGTSDIAEAGKWGPVVSVWPVVDGRCGVSLSYAWPEDRSVFWEGGARGNDSDNNDEVVVDRGLATALAARNGREVLFATPPRASAAFLAVPAGLDGELRADLERIRYGL